LNEWRQAKEIFSDAVELPPAERAAFIAEKCAGDRDLQEFVERLLRQADNTGTLAILPDPRHSLAPGELVTSRFRVRRFVGAGGMGEVYEADDLELGGQVALKTLRPALNEDRQFLARFRREVQLARQVTHPNICRIFDLGHDGGRTFLTMEFLEGETLAAYLRREGRLNVEISRRLMAQMTAGLVALHESGVVHRDLKPGNVMITQSSSGPRAVISDFGLARAMEHSGEATSVSVAGHVLGTPDYMAPEQLRGESATPASDIYALGLMMYEIVTGVKAYPGGQLVENAVQRVIAPPLSPRVHDSGISAEWETLILRCLEREPFNRPANAAEVLAVLSGQSTAPTLPVPAPMVRRRFWRTPVAWAAFVLAAAGAFAFTLSLIFRPVVKPEPDVVNTRLTSDPGLSFDPAISRDGKMVAFSSDRAGSGNLDIWVQQVGGVAPIRLTDTAVDETSPDFSPDGTRIVFRSERDGGGIYVVSTLGGQPTLIATGGRNPRYSPDGRSIAFWTGREGSGYLPGSAQVRVVPAGGGEARAVAADFAASLYPVWSPAGDALLCLARKDATIAVEKSLDWYVLPLDGQPPVAAGIFATLEAAKLATPSTQTSDIPLAWLDGPSRVVFAAASGDSTNLFEAEFDEQRKLSKRPRRITNGTTFEGQASVATAVSRLAYSSLRLNFDIWGLPVDAERGVVTGAPRNLTKEESSEGYPSLSADGSRLSYRSRAAGITALRVMNLATGKNTLLLSGQAALRFPCLSADGEMVTYVDAARALVQMPVNGGAARTLCKECGFPFDSGRDGQRILVEPLKPPDDILMLDVASGKISTAVPARQVLLGARWSPDGKWIAFHETSRDTGDVRIFVAPAGAEPAPPARWIAITGDVPGRSPAWSPGGRALYFLSDRDGFRCLYAQLLDPRTKQPAGPPTVVQHLHEGGRSLKFLGNLDNAIGLSVGRGMAVLTLGELTGNIWQRESVP
jgi:serine/threonine protein kinase